MVRGEGGSSTAKREQREEKKAKARRRMKRPQRGALTRPGEVPRLESGAGVAKGAFPDWAPDAA